MIDKINNAHMQNFMDKAESPNTAKPERAAREDDESVSLQGNYARLLAKAGEIVPEDVKAVERARELLSWGQLESPENILAAAKSIAMYGI
jgi:hypothetical protein